MRVYRSILRWIYAINDTVSLLCCASFSFSSTMIPTQSIQFIHAIGLNKESAAKVSVWFESFGETTLDPAYGFEPLLVSPQLTFGFFQSFRLFATPLSTSRGALR